MKKITVILFLGLLTPIIHSCKKPPLPIIEEVENPRDTTGNNNGGNNNGGGVEVSPFVGDWDYTQIDLTNGGILCPADLKRPQSLQVIGDKLRVKQGKAAIAQMGG